MKLYLTDTFRVRFRRLPEPVKDLARKSYRLWKENPQHPSLVCIRVGNRTESCSVRIGIGWRALGVRDGDAMIWFWIGSHADYDKVIRTL